MKDDFSMEAKKIFIQAEKEMFALNHPYVGSEHMLLAILKGDNAVTHILNDYGINYDKFKRNLIQIVGVSHRKSELALYTPLLKRIISSSLENAKDEGSIVKAEHLLISMLEEGEGIAIRILINMSVDLDSLYDELNKSINNKETKKNLLIYDIGKVMNNRDTDELIFKREKEINELIEVLLRKNKNNPLLIGEAGVGKTAIVEEFARMIDKNLVPPFLRDYKVIELDTGSLISGTRYRGDFEDRVNRIIKEVINDGKIILFIDEIHTLVNCGGAEGAVDAANILKPYLARGEIKLIGATTMKEYKKSIELDKALNRRFEIINVLEPNLKDTEYILKHIKNNYEKYHNVVISDDNIRDIVHFTDKYIFNRYNPDKSIDILDSVCAHVQLLRPSTKSILSDLNEQKEKLLIKKKYKEVLETELKIKKIEVDGNKIPITRDDIIKVIEYRANMPVLDNFNAKLNNLYEDLKEIIYGQDNGLREICGLLSEKYLVDNSKLLSILLTGPRGVGKTYTVKEIGNKLFGGNHFIYLDMNSFSSESTISRLIGTSQGYVGYGEDYIFSKINDYPYTIILLDDIDKASNGVKNLIGEIIENGVIRDGKGSELNFNNTTIIMTCSEIEKNNIGFNKNQKSKPINLKYYSVDKIINFNKISISAAKKYIKRETTNFKISKEDVEKIISSSDINNFGMKGLQRELNRLKINKLLTKV